MAGSKTSPSTTATSSKRVQIDPNANGPKQTTDSQHPYRKAPQHRGLETVGTDPKYVVKAGKLLDLGDGVLIPPFQNVSDMGKNAAEEEEAKRLRNRARRALAKVVGKK